MIAVSLNSIVRTAMALSALRKKPQLLQSTDEPALRQLAASKIAECLLPIARMVLATNIDTVDPEADDVVTLELAVRPGAEPVAAKAIEKAAVAAMMQDLDGNSATEDLRELRANLHVIALLQSKPPLLKRG